MQMRFFLKGASSVAASGMTGPAEIPDPPAERKRTGFRARARTAGGVLTGLAVGVPRVLALSFRASMRLTVGLGLATVVVGLVPAATAMIARLLMNTVVTGIAAHTAHRPAVVTLRMSLPGTTLTLPTRSVLSALVVLAVAQLMIFMISSFGTAVTTACQQLLQERVGQVVQLRVMAKATELDLGFFEDSRSYDLLRQTQKEVVTRPVTMITTVFTLIQTVITLATMSALLVGLSPWLAVVTLAAPAPAFVADIRYGMRTFQLTLWGAPIKRRMEYLANLVTTDTAAKEIALFGLGGFFTERFRLLGAVFYRRLRKLATRRYLLGAGWGTLSTIVGSATYLFVAVQAVAGRLSLGDLALYTAAVGSVQTAVSTLFRGLSTVHENGLYLNNLEELVALRPGITAPREPVEPAVPVRGRLTFEHVTFTYPGAKQPALRDVNLEIPAGETVAVVGRNGAGKSTLIKLACRLYDPTDGRVLLDGIDIRTLDPARLRSELSGMFQDYTTYQATAAENIGLGHVPSIDDRPRIDRAAVSAGAHEMIGALPMGYDSPLGKWFERGSQLSGGQWQKIAMARAFMRDAPLLVLDEPTAALDAQAEHELFERLGELADGRTTLYVSHRFSTVRMADRIVVVDDGTIIEDGTHEALLDRDGEYARLFTLQASAYITPAPAAAGPSSRSSS